MASLSLVKLLLAFVGLLLGSAHAQMLMGMSGMYGGYGGYGGMGMLGGGYGGFGGGYPMMGGAGLFEGFSEDDGDDGFGESLRLTCLHNSTNHRGFLTDAIAVTVRYSDAGFGGGMGGMGSYDPYSMGGFGGGQRGRGSPLKATVQLLSSAQGKGTIVFTKMARIEDGCSKFTMGGIHSPSSNNNNNMGLGFSHMGMGMGFGGGQNGAGVIKENININFNLQTIFVDSLDGFTSLNDLAGRGVAVCSDSSYGWDWEAECEGPMFACCALKYDNHDVSLDVNSFDDNGFNGRDFHGRDFNGRDFDGRDFDGRDFDGRDFDGDDFPSIDDDDRRIGFNPRVNRISTVTYA